MPFCSKKSTRIRYPHEALPPANLTGAKKQIREWQAGGKDTEDIDFLLGTIKALDLVVLRDGTLLDHNQEESFSMNQIKTILRRQYIEEKRPLTGKALCVLVGMVIKDLGGGVMLIRDKIDRDVVPLAEIMDNKDF